MFWCAREPIPLRCLQRAGRALRLGAGRLSFFESLQPPDSCSLRPGAPPRQQPGGLAQDAVPPARPQTEAAAPTKLCLLSLSLCVNICRICVWRRGRERHMTHKRAHFAGSKSAPGDVSVLSGLAGHAARLSCCRAAPDHTFRNADPVNLWFGGCATLSFNAESATRGGATALV